ncbi:MAG: murein biosynthesis integral membrane protein MurJ [Chlamydiae bacterium]|nr:murein biosynthesis integral membrane protein MurJ [Chlamydiota bacterium]
MTSSLSLYAKRFFSGTFLSRLSGLGRDFSMAFAFGDHPSVAAFMVAFRLSNLFRRLLGEGPFQSAFIPYFESIKILDRAKSALFFRKLTLLFVFILLLLIAVTEIAIWQIPSHLNVSEGNQEILTLIRWMLPGLLFICLYGLNISLLHCHDYFFIPSFAPFICNAIWILGALFLRNQPPTSAMITLSKLVVIGFIGQWLITLPATVKFTSINIKEWLTWNIPSEIKNFAKSFGLGIIGVGAMQINSFFDSIFARYADLKGPVYLWYSIRLEQLALAIFGIACVATVVPRLSRAMINHDMASATSYFSFSFRRILAVMIPCTFAIFALAVPAINLLYGRGQFTEIAVAQTALCLWAYGLSLVPTTMVILFSSLFYGQDDFKTPTWASLITVVINLILNGLFVFGLGMGAISTALATSLSSWLNFLILQRLSQKRGRNHLYSFSKAIHLIFACSFAWFCALATEYFLYPTTISLIFSKNLILSRSIADQIISFILPFFSFIIGLAGYSILFKIQDLVELFQEFFLFRTTKASK